MISKAQRPFVFTGWHMLAILVAFFGVIITVNMTMAYLANSTWSGLISKNTYVASQDFNKRAAIARKWLESGIDGELGVSGNEVSYRLTKSGAAVSADEVKVHFRHPVGEKHDFALTLAPAGDGVYRGTIAGMVDDGAWIVELESRKNGETVYHEATRIFISGGEKK